MPKRYSHKQLVAIFRDCESPKLILNFRFSEPLLSDVLTKANAE
jgi:hypothetical protein